LQTTKPRKGYKSVKIINSKRWNEKAERWEKYFEYEIPEEWEVNELGKIANVNPLRPKNMKWDEDIPTSFIPMSSINEDLGIIETIEKRKYSEISKGYTYIQENDVIFAKITPCMENGKCTIATNLLNEFAFGSTEFHVIRDSERINNNFIYQIFRQEKIRRKAKNSFTGTAGQQRVPPLFIEKLFVFLPPIPEQKAIAEILSNVDEKIQKEELHKSSLEKLKKGLMQQLLTGKIRVK
tara:strand:+ start:84 stop:797 length:714 start_codon:yes stop_codon:yes gene_type:complete